MYYFDNDWQFLLADEFPLKKALDKWKDGEGRFFYEREYEESGCASAADGTRVFTDVTLPHTFNDGDLFKDRIEDAGSGQKRTFGFYRKWFALPESGKKEKVFLEFEGMRQTCYLYVNGTMAGYYEAGVAPIGFDITSFLVPGQKNLIAVATDNTTTRNIPFCIAETPNKPDTAPGSYLLKQMEDVPEEFAGVGFQWNTNDFNPSVGGITRPVKLHRKPMTYLTLPLYSNLRTKGVYVYGADYDLEQKTAKIAVEAEVRNERDEDVHASIEVRLYAHEDAKKEAPVVSFTSEKVLIPASGELGSPLTITPEDAYVEEILPNGKKHYVPADEKNVAPTVTDSYKTAVIKAVSEDVNLRFWNIEDPYLYKVEVILHVEGCEEKKSDAEKLYESDSTVIETGFRKAEYDKDRGMVINGKAVWLTGYAQRATNEWAAIGIAPEWLKDMDAMLIKESGANHIRWMHVAAPPADIRSFDRHGVTCTQPGGDKEAETFGRQWDQRVELMRDVIISFRNHPSILFWEAGNNSIGKEHMREMRLLKETLDPNGGRLMGCRTINTEDVLAESEYVGTMLNRHAARFLSEHGPITETEYSREEAPRRIWDDFTPPDFDYRNQYIGKGGKKQKGRDFYDLTMEDLCVAEAFGYNEFFHDRIGGASGKDWYSACAGLCWTDSAQHGRQSYSENGRMSGKVDPVRIRKQNFYLYQVLQSEEAKVKIIGHWNYPAYAADNYKYPIKKFNGQFWEETGEWGQRDPLHKTVYVAGSYPIAKVELFINGKSAGVSEKIRAGFLFVFEGIDVTKQGQIEAVGYDYDGREAARDRIKTAGEPAKLVLTPHTSPKGFLADGCDIMYVDVEVKDKDGNLCPLCSERIDFTCDGEAVFLGGYNSGKFDGYGHDDSVIHQNHVFAECGVNRVFLRSTKNAGKVRLKAWMRNTGKEICGSCENGAVVSGEDVNKGNVSIAGEDRLENGGTLLADEVEMSSVSTDLSTFVKDGPAAWYEDYEKPVSLRMQDAFPAIKAADLAKYTPEDQLYCKVLVKGQEPDTRGVRSVNKNGSIWGAVMCILDRMLGAWKDDFTYTYDEEKQSITLKSGDVTAVATAGHTHLLVNGQENLMDGEPYVTPEGIFVMEINALVPYIKNTSCQYDEKVNVLRVDRII